MHLMNNTPHQLMTPDRAEELATLLNSDDCDDWTYKAKHDPSGKGWSFVEVYDEDGVLLGGL